MKVKLTSYGYIGIILILLGILGFFTFADDLQHLGEIIAAAGLTISGLLLLLAEMPLSINKDINLKWVAIGILGGMVLGIFIDRMMFGTTLGFGAGYIAGRIPAYFRKNK